MSDKILTIKLKFITPKDQIYFETYKERLIYYITKITTTFGWKILEVIDE